MPCQKEKYTIEIIIKNKNKFYIKFIKSIKYKPNA